VRRLLYPQRRVIQDREIIQWAVDRLVDRAIAEAGIEIDYSEIVSPPVRTPTLAEAIALLEDDGVATFEK